MEKKGLLTIAFISVLLFSVAAFFVKSTKANPFPTDPVISIESPVNKTYSSNSLALKVTVVTKYEGWYVTASAKTLVYRLDGKAKVSITETNYSYDEEQYESTFTGSAILSELTEGVHKLTVHAKYDYGDRIFDAQSSTYFTIDLPAPNGTPSPTPTPSQSPSQEPTITPELTEPFPATLVAGVSGTSVAIIGVGILVYFKKRKH